MAYVPIIHGNNLVRVYKMDPMNDECIVYNETPEMLNRIKNHGAISSRPLVAIGIQFYAWEMCSHPVAAANCLHDNHNISPVVANFPYTQALHAAYTIDAAHETQYPFSFMEMRKNIYESLYVLNSYHDSD